MSTSKATTSATTSTTTPPLIAIIGGTGAQGRPIVQHLVKDGAYRVRLLTRDINHTRAKQLQAMGQVELVQGSALSEATVTKLFEGADGAFVNLDGFAIGEKRETYWGQRIFEIAIGARVRHYVWGSVPTAHMDSGFDANIRAGHMDAKGRVVQYMKSFPSPVNGTTTWSVLTSTAYLDMLQEFFAPVILPNKNKTRVFFAPLGAGRIHLIDLEDLGFYARYVFDHPKEFEGRDWRVASEAVTLEQIAKTFTKVTGIPAAALDLPESVYESLWGADKPAGYQDSAKLVQPGEDGPMTWKANFRGFWRLFKADVARPVDYRELDRIHPQRVNLEGWMRKVKYNGNNEGKQVLKGMQDGRIAPMRLRDIVVTVLRGGVRYMKDGISQVGVDYMKTEVLKYIQNNRQELLS